MILASVKVVFMGSRAQKPFPIGKAWRPVKCLELIHADASGLRNAKSLGD